MKIPSLALLLVIGDRGILSPCGCLVNSFLFPQHSSSSLQKTALSMTAEKKAERRNETATPHHAAAVHRIHVQKGERDVLLSQLETAEEQVRRLQEQLIVVEQAEEEEDDDTHDLLLQEKDQIIMDWQTKYASLQAEFQATNDMTRTQAKELGVLDSKIKLWKQQQHEDLQYLKALESSQVQTYVQNLNLWTQWAQVLQQQQQQQESESSQPKAQKFENAQDLKDLMEVKDQQLEALQVFLETLERDNADLKKQLLETARTTTSTTTKPSNKDDNIYKERQQWERQLEEKDKRLQELDKSFQALQAKESTLVTSQRVLQDALKKTKQQLQHQNTLVKQMEKQLATNKKELSNLQTKYQKEVQGKKETSLSSSSSDSTTIAAAESSNSGWAFPFNNNNNNNNNEANTKQQFPEIRNWKLTANNEISGVVYFHPQMDDGNQIITNILVDETLAKDFAIVETRSGSKYRLGKASQLASSLNSSSPSSIPPTKEKSPPTTSSSAPSPAVATKKESTTDQPSKESSPNVKQAFPNVFFSPKASSAAAVKEEATQEEEKAVSSSADDSIKASKTPPVPNFVNPFFSPVTKSKKSHVSESSLSSSPAAVEKREPEKPDYSDLELPLTGETIGDGKYLMAGTAKRSANGRCKVGRAYVADANGHPTGDPVAVKMSHNVEAMKREYSNFKKLWAGQQKGHIIKCLDYFPEANADKKSQPSSALILERGEEDLKQYHHRIMMEEDEIRSTLYSALKCLETVHSNRMVWTDLKSENFVLVEDYTKKSQDSEIIFKAIDWESAVNVKGNPLDYTPEACPPEFCQAYVSGDPHGFVLDYNYDIWSFGMMAYELASGAGYYDGVNQETVIKRVANNEIPKIQDKVEDSQLADMITQCLAIGPMDRPTVAKLLRHPYFKSLPASSKFFGLFI